MAQVEIKLNGRTYSLVCGAGEEERLMQLASHVRETLDGVVGEHGQAGEARLMLMTALLIADQMFDARTDCEMAASAAAAAALREVAERAKETPASASPAKAHVRAREAAERATVDPAMGAQSPDSKAS